MSFSCHGSDAVCDNTGGNRTVDGDNEGEPGVHHAVPGMVDDSAPDVPQADGLICWCNIGLYTSFFGSRFER